MTTKSEQIQTATKEHFIGMLGSFRTAMLVTHNTEGELHGRPMALAKVDDAGDLWLLTDVDSPKVAELNADARVSVNLQEGSKFATLTGQAEVMRDGDHVQRLWNESWRTWYPKGPDESIALIKVVPNKGEYWDNAGINGIRYLFKTAKAYLEGERPHLGRDIHAKIDMQH